MLEAYDLEGVDPDDAPAEGDQVVSWIFTGLGDFLEDYIDSVTNFLSAEVEPFFLAACVLFVAVYGYGIIYGWIESSAKRISRDVAKLAVIMVIFFQWGEILPFLTELFFDDPADLTADIIEAVVDDIDLMDGGNAVSILDTVALSGLVYLGGAIDNWEILSAATWMTVFEAIVLIFCIFFLLVSTVFVLMKSFLIMTLFLSVGQLFIPFLLFEQTRGMGVKWWNQMTTYMFVPVFSMLLLSIIFAIGFYQFEALNAAVVAGEPVASSNLVGSILASLVGALTMREVPDIARTVGQGFAFEGGASGLGKGAAQKGWNTAVAGANKGWSKVKEVYQGRNKAKSVD